MLKNIDKWGGPETFPHMAAGWAVAGNTPFMWTKQVASNFGGTRNPLVVSWPARIKAKGEIRSQFQHVVDIAPTVLEAAGIPEPKTVNGVAQTPMEGVSMVYTFDDAKAAGPAQDAVLRDLRQPRHLSRRLGGRHRAQGAVGSARRGTSSPRTSGSSTTSTRTSASPTTSRPAIPAKLKELQALFMKEAERYRVLPIDDRVLERFDPAMAGRPDLMAGRKSLTVYEGMTGMMENAFINVKNQSVTITADVEIPAGGANGVILCPGRPLRRLEPVRQGRQARLHLQLRRPPGVHGQRHRAARARQGDDHARLRLRRQRPRQGRDRHALRQRQEGRLGTRRAHQRQHLLGRRRRRRGRGRRHQRELGVHAAREQVHRHRSRRCGWRSSDQPSSDSIDSIANHHRCGQPHRCSPHSARRPDRWPPLSRS